jgi:hypothetical protein
MEHFRRILLLTCLLPIICHGSESGPPLRLHYVHWLKGFENCTNHLLFFNNIQLEILENSFFLNPNTNNYLTVGLYDENASGIFTLKRDYRKNLFCQTVSILYSSSTDDFHPLQQAIQKLTILRSDLNPISGKTPNGTIQVLPSYYFLIGPNFLSNAQFMKTLFLMWQHPFKTDIFHIEANPDYGEIIPNYETLAFFCHLCLSWKSPPKKVPKEGGGNPRRSRKVIPNLLKYDCNPTGNFLSTGFRSEMDSVALHGTLSGRNLSWWIPVFAKFSPNITRLRRLASIQSRHYEVLKMKPFFDEIITSILMEDMPKISTQFGDTSSPWLSALVGASHAFKTVVCGEVGLTFLTCHGVYKGITFSSYLKPFGKDVWLSLIFSILISVFILVLVVHILQVNYGWNDLVPKRNSEFTFNSTFFTLFALLMDTEVHIGVVSKSRRFSFRWFMLSWIFGSLILKSAYRGDNISTVIVPAVSINILTSFSQLKSGFTLYTKSSYSGLQANTGSSIGTAVQSRAGMAFQKYLSWKYGLKVLTQIEKGNQTNEDYTGVTSTEDLALIKLYKSIVNKQIGNKTDLGHETVHELLGSCGKTVFVEESHIVDHMLVNLKSFEDTNSNSYYRGTQVLFPQHFSWSFSKVGGDYLPRKFTGLFFSGIFGYWEKVILNSELGRTEVDSGDEHRPIPLKSNIITIFLAFIVLCIFSGFVFLVEICGLFKKSERQFDSQTETMSFIYRS